jgi:hypothetical protein
MRATLLVSVFSAPHQAVTANLKACYVRDLSGFVRSRTNKDLSA